MNLNSPTLGRFFLTSLEHALSVLPMGGLGVIGPDLSAPIARDQKEWLGWENIRKNLVGWPKNERARSWPSPKSTPGQIGE